MGGAGAGRAADAHNLPSAHELQLARGRTLRHIPAAARFLWGQTLSGAVAAAAHHNDARAWTELLMLPQCVLAAPPRAGRRHKRAAAAYTLDRLRRWCEGERRGLWDDACRRSGGPKRQLSENKRRELAIDLAREGFDRKACNALLHNGLCPETADTVAALRALHPAQPQPAVDLASLPLADEISEDVVARALRSFPADTAPGPSGLRIQHLREAGAPGSTHSLVVHLARLVNLMAQGQACPLIAPVLAGAGLVAVPKPNGGVRPIAVGEILRRLTGKCLMQLVQEEARRTFWPTQLGVGIKSGAETGIHTVRAWTKRHEGAHNKVLLKLDFSNAFNRISRCQVLESAVMHFPGLARWVTWCYQQPSALRFGDTMIPSAGGVQQGDPLGPLLFATAIHQLTQDLRAGPLDLALFYLDDGIIAGDVASVGAALSHIQTRGVELGLALNAAKCEVVAVGPLQHAALAPHLPPQFLSAPDGSSRLKRNFEFLGGAIGDDAFVQAHTRARVEAVGPLLDALAELGDAQVGLRLLRSCAGYGRLVHSMRCNPPHSQRAALQLFDGKVQAAFSSITGLHLTATQRAQVGRGLGFAGVGVRCSSLDAPAAFLASVGSCAVACEEADPAYVAAAVVLDPACTQATTALNAQLQHPLAPGAALSLKQKALTRLLDEASWQAQLAASSTTRQALLRSEAEPGARAFLVAKPGGVTRMETALFVTELRHRLGIPEASEDCWCPQCHGILDAHSLHASTCVAGGEKTLRHTAVRDALCKWAELSGQGYSRKKNAQAYSYHNDPKMSALKTADQLTFFCLASTAPLLRLIWPSRPHSGRMLWCREQRRLWQLLQPMQLQRQLT